MHFENEIEIQKRVAGSRDTLFRVRARLVSEITDENPKLTVCGCLTQLGGKEHEPVLGW